MNADRPAVDPREPCKPMLRSWGPVETSCYWPDEHEVAEARVPFSPLNPEAAVRRHAHLDLAQILISTNAVPGMKTTATDITYIFGTIPSASGSVPDPAQPEPAFVLVAEGRVPERAPRLGRVRQYVDWVGTWERKTARGSLWTYANRSGGVYVVVTATFPADIVESIGKAIIGSNEAD